MSKIILLDSLIKEYRKWTLKLKSASQRIEDNILQNDAHANIEEKVISIAISSAIVYVLIAIVGLFGVVVHPVVSVFVFIAGWFLSKHINKKIFGVKRDLSSLKGEEKILLERLIHTQNKHKEILLQLNENKNSVFFTNYIFLKRDFNQVVNRLLTYDASNLALKYRLQHSTLVKKYQHEIKVFHEIYANKKGK